MHEDRASFIQRGNWRGGMKQPKANGTKPDYKNRLLLYGVLDAGQLRGAIPELKKLLKWAAHVLAI